jgi:type II secretory pathway component GspD/PulD (secretin)
MRTSKLFGTLAATAAAATVSSLVALTPATAWAQGGADATGKDISKFLDRKPEAAQLKREIDVSVEEADLRDVMDEIGRRVGRNIIVEPDIHEKVTISLRKIPWRDAVDVIAKMTKCEVEQRGSILVLTQPPKVTIQFTDANVRTVLQLLAAYSGKNIIISPEVRGDVTLDLHEVHWLKALYAIVRTVGDYEVVEETADLLRVVPRSSIAQQLKTELIPLKYLRPPTKYLATPPRTSVGTGPAGAGAANLFVGTPKPPTGVAEDEFTLYKALKGIVDSAGSAGPSGKSTIQYDSQKNGFLVRGTQPLIEEIKKIVDRLDEEPSQVYVEVRFVSTQDNNFLDFGLQPADQVNGISFGGPFPNGEEVNAGVVTTGKVASSNTNVNTAFLAPTGSTPVGTFPFAFGNGVSRFANTFQIPAVLDFRGLQATLNMIDRDTRTRLLQQPSLFLRDNEDAVLFVGEDVPFAQINANPDLNGNVVQTIGPGQGSPIAIGFSLFLSAHVVPNTDRIMMTVIPRVSQPGGSTGTENIFDAFPLSVNGQTVNLLLPHTKEQALVTHIMVDDGQTAVIGGLLTESDNEVIVRIPILSHIPIIGNLFTHTHREKEVDNLVIMITTTIVRSRAQSVALFKKHDAQMKARDYFYKKYEAAKDEKAGAPAATTIDQTIPAAPEPGGTAAPGTGDEKK